MSLDVYLTRKGTVNKGGSRIFIREDGSTREISREEWDRRVPDREPATVEQSDSDRVFSANITHNLARMAEAAGIYQACWRPEEIGVAKAGHLILFLRKGLEKLRADPEQYRTFNALNGWGTYDQFVPWVERYLAACETYPDADVSVSR